MSLSGWLWFVPVTCKTDKYCYSYITFKTERPYTGSVVHINPYLKRNWIQEKTSTPVEKKTNLSSHEQGKWGSDQARWRSSDGLTHKASWHSLNKTICEDYQINKHKSKMYLAVIEVKFLVNVREKKWCLFTLLKVCPPTASDKDSISSKCHALIIEHQCHTTISVAWCLSYCQTLQKTKDKSHRVCKIYSNLKQLKMYEKNF